MRDTGGQGLFISWAVELKQETSDERIIHFSCIVLVFLLLENKHFLAKQKLKIISIIHISLISPSTLGGAGSIPQTGNFVEVLPKKPKKPMEHVVFFLHPQLFFSSNFWGYIIFFCRSITTCFSPVHLHENSIELIETSFDFHLGQVGLVLSS